MRMLPPFSDVCSVAVGEASLVREADGTFNVPEMYAGALEAQGWTHVEDGAVVAPVLEVVALNLDAPLASQIRETLIAEAMAAGLTMTEAQEWADGELAPKGSA